MEQWFIMVFSPIAIYLVSRQDKYSRYGFILGLLAQPFWAYTSFVHEQWGIFVMTLFYAYSWANGIIKNFKK